VACGTPAGVPWWMSVDTAISFVTNTNWQSYAGESTLGFAAQMADYVLWCLWLLLVSLMLARLARTSRPGSRWGNDIAKANGPLCASLTSEGAGFGRG
jgi:hypothetical protein